MQSLQNQLLPDSDISFSLKQSTQQIQFIFNNFAEVTEQLDKKILSVFEKHQSLFFEAYKKHMKQVEKEIKGLKSIIQQKQNYIQQLQKQEIVPKLNQKIKQLQKDLAFAYNKNQLKDKMIYETRRDLDLAKTNINHLEERIKNDIRQSVRHRLNIQKGIKHVGSQQSIDINNKTSRYTIFATQVKPRAQSKLESKQSISYNNSPSRYEIETTLPRQQQYDIVKQRLTLEVKKLTKANKKLIYSNVKIRNQHSDLEQFFINCIDQTKKLVSLKNQHSSNKITETQFSKQDKMNILLLLLQNDEIISAIYSLLFKKQNEARSTSILQSNKMQSLMEIQRFKLNKSKRQHKSIDKKEERNSSLELRLPNIPNTIKYPGLLNLRKKSRIIQNNDF